MKFFLAALLSILSVAGGEYYHYKCSPMSVGNLVKSHPELQKVCDLSGGCFFVNVSCTKYDMTGNSSLRGDVFWKVTSWWSSYTGYGIEKFSGSNSLNTAIKDWLDTSQRRDRFAGEPKIVYPNSKPCDPDCLKGQK